MDPNQPWLSNRQNRNNKPYFVQSFCLWHLEVEKLEMGFEWITNSEIVEVLMHRKVAGDSHMLSKQTQCIGFCKGWAGPSPCFVLLRECYLFVCLLFVCSSKLILAIFEQGNPAWFQLLYDGSGLEHEQFGYLHCLCELSFERWITHLSGLYFTIHSLCVNTRHKILCLIYLWKSMPVGTHCFHNKFEFTQIF